MSLATFAPATGDFDDNLAQFLATVPAAREFDRDSQYAGLPRREHRPARCNDNRAAIDESLRGA